MQSEAGEDAKKEGRKSKRETENNVTRGEKKRQEGSQIRWQ
jgi:hypothetical protein